MHQREHKESSTFLRWIQAFFCFKYRLMSFKEELQKEKLSLPLIYWKKINFYLNLVDIQQHPSLKFKVGTSIKCQNIYFMFHIFQLFAEFSLRMFFLLNLMFYSTLWFWLLLFCCCYENDLRQCACFNSVSESNYNG